MPGEKVEENPKELAKLLCEAVEPDPHLELRFLRFVLGEPWYFHEKTASDGRPLVTVNRFGDSAPGNPVCYLEHVMASFNEVRTFVPEGYRMRMDDEVPAKVFLYPDRGHSISAMLGDWAHYAEGQLLPATIAAAVVRQKIAAQAGR